jgi:hypothetical protein
MDSDVAVQEYKPTFGHLSIELCHRDNCFFLFIQGDFESCADILTSGRTPQ